MTMELIDKNEAIKVLQDTPCGVAGIKARMVGRIEKMPTVDMLEQIRDEIVEEQSCWREDEDAEWYECRRILRIIDKYRGDKNEI